MGTCALSASNQRESQRWYRLSDTSPAIGNDDTVYIGSEDGHVYAIGPGVS
jgi:hypothetical protein